MAKKKASDVEAVPAVAVQLSPEQVKFIEALKENLGIVSKASEAAGTSRQQHYNWLKGISLPETQSLYQAAVEEVTEFVDDVVEDALLQGVLNGDADLIKYASNCRLKRRGYGQEVFLPGGDSDGGQRTFVLLVQPPTLTLPAAPVNGSNGKPD